MGVKAIDIARELNISKATVSLALNDKPGVNPKTKQRILACKERLEKGIYTAAAFSAAGKVIKVVIALRGLCVVRDKEIDLWTDVNAVFDNRARDWGLLAEISYFYVDRDYPERLAAECNKEEVAGVVLFATELYPEDAPLFFGIRKPLVVYDNDLGIERLSSVMVDTKGGVRMAVDYLLSKGKRDIVYVARDMELYNYRTRREGFVEAMTANHIPYNEGMLVTVSGERIDDIYHSLKRDLQNRPLPDAFLMECCQISIPFVRACRELGVAVPGDVSLLGIDELPHYLTGEKQLTTIRVPHTERAKLTMDLLYHEMHDPGIFKSKIYTNCRLVEGETV